MLIVTLQRMEPDASPEFVGVFTSLDAVRTYLAVNYGGGIELSTIGDDVQLCRRPGVTASWYWSRALFEDHHYIVWQLDASLSTLEEALEGDFPPIWD